MRSRPFICGRNVLRRGRKMSVVPAGVRLSNVRVSLMGTVDERRALGLCLSSLGGSCSCVLVSYVPDLKVLAVGTLTTTSDMVIPIRTRCLPLGNVARLVGAVNGMRERLGPGLGVSKMLLALTSVEAGLTEAARSDLQRGCKGRVQVFGAIVPITVATTRDDTTKRDVCRCSGGKAITGTCTRFAERIVRYNRGREGGRRSSLDQ